MIRNYLYYITLNIIKFYFITQLKIVVIMKFKKNMANIKIFILYWEILFKLNQFS